MVSSTKSDKKKSFFLLGKKLAGGGLLLCLIAIVLLTYNQSSLSSRVIAKLNLLRQTGIPTTDKDVKKWYPNPTGKTEAKKLIASLTEHYVNKKRYDILPIVGVLDYELPFPWDKETVSLAHEYLAENEKVAQLFLTLSKTFPCFYLKSISQRDFLRDLDLEHLKSIEVGESFLKLKLFLEWQDKKNEQAFQTLQTRIHLVETLRTEPTIMSFLSYIMGHSSNMDICQKMLHAKFLDKNEIQQLASFWKKIETWKCFQRAIQVEVYYSTLLFQLLANGELKGFPDYKIQRSWEDQYYKLSGGLALDQIFYLNQMARLSQVTQEEITKNSFILFPVKPGWEKHRVSATILPSLFASLSKAQWFQAKHALTLAMMAIEHHRLEKGPIPDSLEEVTTTWQFSLPLDPYTQKPLKYEKLSSGYILYSLGENRLDDEGKGRDQMQNEDDGWDIVILGKD